MHTHTHLVAVLSACVIAAVCLISTASAQYEMQVPPGWIVPASTSEVTFTQAADWGAAAPATSTPVAPQPTTGTQTYSFADGSITITVGDLSFWTTFAQSQAVSAAHFQAAVIAAAAEHGGSILSTVGGMTFVTCANGINTSTTASITPPNDDPVPYPMILYDPTTTYQFTPPPLVTQPLPTPSTVTSSTSSSTISRQLTARPSLVKPQSTARVFWSAETMMACSVSGTNGDHWDDLSSGDDGKETSPIDKATTYTLNCQDAVGGIHAESARVRLLPIWREF